VPLFVPPSGETSGPAQFGRDDQKTMLPMNETGQRSVLVWQIIVSRRSSHSISGFSL
jgi:hypothetical protein